MQVLMGPDFDYTDPCADIENQEEQDQCYESEVESLIGDDFDYVDVCEDLEGDQ